MRLILFNSNNYFFLHIYGFKCDIYVFIIFKQNFLTCTWITFIGKLMLKFDSFLIVSLCDTLWSFVVLGMCVHAPVREYLSLLWHETHTKNLTARSPARPDVDEGREVPDKKEGQLTKGGRREAVDNWEQRRTVGLR